MSNDRYAILGEFFRKKPLVIAGLCGLIGCLFAAGYLKEREAAILRIAEPQNIVVAVRDIDAGDVIDETNARVSKVPRRFVQPGAFAGVENVAGRIAAVPIQKGAHVTAANALRTNDAHRISAIVPAGRRAFAVPLADESLVRLLRPNDFVDVIWTANLGSESQSHLSSMTIADNIQVLAVGSYLADHPLPAQKKSKGSIFGGGADPIARERPSVVLAVTKLEAQWLALARESGTLSVAVKAFGDEAIESQTSPTTTETITSGREDFVPLKRGFKEYKGR